MNEGIFFVIAIFSFGCAVMAAQARQLLVAAVSLMGLLAATAGIYVLLDADFIAGVQILVYVAGTVVLIVFAVMLTQSGGKEETRPFMRRRLGALAVSGGFLFAALSALASGQLKPSDNASLSSDTVRPIGRLLLSPDAGGYVLPLELISLLLLVVLIGGIVLARADAAPESRDEMRGEGREG